ncbi:MAG: hypothetical protein LBK46_03820 [Oscillospiraceae bacterium]|jgi:hypothetical protein|nr:hypothetical protein [Oscillospiraceae bacterium]
MAYTLSGHKGGYVRFMPFEGTVTKEREQYSGRVTQYPVESGADINDHMLIDPRKLTIDGAVCNGLADVYALRAMHENREICVYVGRTMQDGMVITSLNFDYTSQNKYGASFSATLQHIQITSAEYVQTGAYPMSLQDKGKGAGKTTQNKGQQTIKITDKTVSDHLVAKTQPSLFDRTSGAYNGLTL